MRLLLAALLLCLLPLADASRTTQTFTLEADLQRVRLAEADDLNATEASRMRHLVDRDGDGQVSAAEARDYVDHANLIRGERPSGFDSRSLLLDGRATLDAAWDGPWVFGGLAGPVDGRELVVRKAAAARMEPGPGETHQLSLSGRSREGIVFLLVVEAPPGWKMEANGTPVQGGRFATEEPYLGFQAAARAKYLILLTPDPREAQGAPGVEGTLPLALLGLALLRRGAGRLHQGPRAPVPR